MKKKLFAILSASLCVIFLVSCSGRIRNEDLHKTHDLLIIPYKSAPIYIYTTSIGVYIAAGLLFTEIVEAYNKGDKVKYIDRLDKLRGEWNPSTAMAKECSDLIKNNRKVKINNIEIAKIRVLPGNEGEDNNVFSANTLRVGETRLSPSYKWWSSDTSAIQYKNEYSHIKADWALELHIATAVIREDLFTFFPRIKIFNIETGEAITSEYVIERFNVSPVILDESGFKQFEQDFAIGARRACGRTLNNMGLIDFNEK